MKKLILTIVILIVSLEILGCAIFFFLAAVNDDRADKNDIIEFVRLNEDALLLAIKTGSLSDFENTGVIMEIDASPAVVDFYCGGAGMGSNTSYVGFYYTRDNNMAAVWCAPSSADLLTSCGNGFEWREPNGDNRYYTEQICGNFYYYEASF